jgi:hypothetical protein
MEKRLQIDFTEKAYSELEALQTRLDAKSKSEVIRDALGVLTWLTDEVLEKKHVILVEKPKDGVTREVVFHFLERVRSQNHSDAAVASRSTNSPAITAQR